MRNEALAALLVVAIIAGAGVGYLVGNVRPPTIPFVPQSERGNCTYVGYMTLNLPHGPQLTHYYVCGGALYTNTTSTSCIQTGIHGSLFVRVVSDNSNSQISGANVTVTILNYCGSEYSIPLGYTNDTGYASSPAGWTGVLLVNVTDAGVGHIFLTETSGAVSLAAVGLPSGLTVIKPIACYGAFPAACSNATTTTTAYPIASG